MTSERQPNQPFSARWWDAFLAESELQSRPRIFRNVLGQQRVTAYREHVLEILRCLARLRSARYGYRVYVDGAKLSDAEMALVYDAPPHDGETLEDWVARVFGERKFGIILNAGEKFVAELSDDVAALLAPLFARIGFPREGVQFSIFIGNYDKTPLGIHQDKRGENVMHFHVGPGDKTMHLWQRDRYKALLEETGLTRDRVDELRAHATRFDFGPGDVFFMPEGEYHIGSQDGLSIGITVWQYNHTNDHLASNLHQMVFRQFDVQPEILIHGDDRPLEDTSGLDDVLAKFRLGPDLAPLCYEDLMRSTYRDWRYCLHSNAGYRNAPFPRKGAPPIDPDGELRCTPPYRILHRRTDDGTKLHVYVRGQRFEMRYFPCVIALVEALNTGRPHRVRDLLRLLDPSWDERIGLHVLQEIHVRHGIEATKVPALA